MKNETKHSPEPFSVDYSGPCRLAIVDKTGRDIAHLCLQSENGDEDEANAKLFAAAPELLAALRDLVADASKSPEFHPSLHAAISLANARAAIARAERGSE